MHLIVKAFHGILELKNGNEILVGQTILKRSQPGASYP